MMLSKDTVAAITEFVSVGMHAMNRLLTLAHSKRDRIAVIGDGSFSFCGCQLFINYTLPEAEICGYWSSLGEIGTFLICQRMLYY